ncbi:MAG: hypothetical protein GY861_20345, partial [bacterium]|nr:hypothetical protein [bacterium]
EGQAADAYIAQLAALPVGSPGKEWTDVQDIEGTLYWVYNMGPNLLSLTLTPDEITEYNTWKEGQDADAYIAQLAALPVGSPGKEWTDVQDIEGALYWVYNMGPNLLSLTLTPDEITEYNIWKEGQDADAYIVQLAALPAGSPGKEWDTVQDVDGTLYWVHNMGPNLVSLALTSDEIEGFNAWKGVQDLAEQPIGSEGKEWTDVQDIEGTLYWVYNPEFNLFLELTPDEVEGYHEWEAHQDVDAYIAWLAEQPIGSEGKEWTDVQDVDGTLYWVHNMGPNLSSLSLTPDEITEYNTWKEGQDADAYIAQLAALPAGSPGKEWDTVQDVDGTLYWVHNMGPNLVSLALTSDEIDGYNAWIAEQENGENPPDEDPTDEDPTDEDLTPEEIIERNRALAEDPDIAKHLPDDYDFEQDMLNGFQDLQSAVEEARMVSNREIAEDPDIKKHLPDDYDIEDDRKNDYVLLQEAIEIAQNDTFESNRSLVNDPDIKKYLPDDYDIEDDRRNDYVLLQEAIEAAQLENNSALANDSDIKKHLPDDYNIEDDRKNDYVSLQ